MWLIDDIQVKSGTAVYRVYNTSGVWRNSDGSPTRPANAAPLSIQKSVIQGDYTLPSDMAFCECEVERTGKLTIPTNRTLTLQNKLTNWGDGSNTKVADGANLIQM